MKKSLIVFLVLIIIIVQVALFSFGSFIFKVFSNNIVDLQNEDTFRPEKPDKQEKNIEYELIDDIEQIEFEPINRDPIDFLPQLTVLINFNNQQLVTSEEEWYEFYFGSGNSVGRYFDTMSKGQFGLIPANESYGEKNNGVIVIDLDRKHANLSSESSDRDFEVWTTVFKEMLSSIDQYIDISQYDIDGDGIIIATELSITMIAAGYEENEYSLDENQVSGTWISEDFYEYIDDIGVSEYIISGELDMSEDYEGYMTTIGVLCHETGHVLGLPDLYDTDYSSIGLGFHSLMAEGNYNRRQGERYGQTPSPLIAWSKIYAGFVEPQLIKTDGVFEIYGQSMDGYNVLRLNEGDGYYLIENIDFGGYGEGIDAFMTHSGIAIWYVNNSATDVDTIWENTVNDNDRKRGVSLIEASGYDDLFKEELDYYKDDYDHYFAKGYVDEYITAKGTVIRVLDKPMDVMMVEIDFID